MRASHWVKNAFVLAPVLFSGEFVEPMNWVWAVSAAVAFCLLSSAVYLTNDIADRREDAAHPLKRDRPIPSGRLSVSAATAGALGCAAGGLGLAAAVTVHTSGAAGPLHGLGLLVWAGGYLALNLLYSFWLKAHAIVDVIVVALGFVLRAVAGAAAISVPISPWMVLCTFTLCLYIALTKRRSEFVSRSAEEAAAARPAQRGYALADLDHMLTVSTALAILTYSLYCLAPRTVSPGGVGSAHLIWTIPLVVYGLFRYNRATRRTAQDPVSVLLHDKVMWLVVLGYVLVAALVIRFGSMPAVRNVLDVKQ